MSSPTVRVDRVPELKQAALTNHLYLANEVLGYDFQETPHAELFACYLQKDPAKMLFELAPVKNRLILWSRGHFKTTASAVEMVQLILNYPDIRILIMSANLAEGTKRLKEVKNQFEYNAKLRRLFPEFCGFKIGNSNQFISPARKKNILREPTVAVASARSTKTGSHYDAIFVDDLVTDENSRSRERLDKSISDFRAIVPLLDPGGYIFVTGTRYNFADAYGWILEQIRAEGLTNWVTSVATCWKCGHTRDNCTCALRTPLFIQTAAHDGRQIGFTVESLEQIRKEEGDEFFALQYENNPLPKSQQVFTRDLIYSHVIPDEQIPGLGTVIIVIDLAFSTSNRSDETVMMVDRISSGVNYIVDCVGGHMTPDEQCEAVYQLAAKYRPHMIYLEDARSAEYFKRMAEMYAGAHKLNFLPVEMVPKGNSKDGKYHRIANIQTVLSQQRLYFRAGLSHWDKIENQLLLFPKMGRHDDWADTIGMVCQAPSGYENVPLKTQDGLPWFMHEQLPKMEMPDTHGLPYGLTG